MAYSPQNVCVYLKAFAGCLAGLAASGKYLNDPAQGDYQVYAQMADAFAQQFDATWGITAPTGFQEDLIAENCEAIWENRSPLKLPDALSPGSYFGLVNAVIALTQQGNAQVVLEGVNPNGCAAPVRASLNSIGTDSTKVNQLTVPLTPGVSGKPLMVADFTPNATGLVSVSVTLSIVTSAHDLVQIVPQLLVGLTAITGGTVLAFGITQEPSSTTQTTTDSSQSFQSPTSSIGGGLEQTNITYTIVYKGLTVGARYGFSVLGASVNNTNWTTIVATMAVTELPILA